MRHLDMIWPLWNVLDMTPTGRGQWYPELVIRLTLRSIDLTHFSN